MADDPFARKLGELGAGFRTQLPARIAELQRLAAAGPSALPRLRDIAHQLAGQGGTFGAPEVSEAARGVEEAELARLPEALRKLAAAAARLAR